MGPLVFLFPTKLSKGAVQGGENFSVENFRYRQRSIILVGLKRDSYPLVFYKGAPI